MIQLLFLMKNQFLHSLRQKFKAGKPAYEIRQLLMSFENRGADRDQQIAWLKDYRTTLSDEMEEEFILDVLDVLNSWCHKDRSLPALD